VAIDSRVAKVIREIEAYVERHPNAADTVEGIGSFWLRSAPDVPASVVANALDALVALGIMEKAPDANGQVIYGRANRAA